MLGSTKSALQSGAEPSWLYSHWVLIWLALVSVVGLGFSTPLFDVDEGAFTEATREMLASGNWVSTYLNGEPRHDKPILIYWLQAVSASVFGLSEGALRLPSMLAAGAWIALMYGFARQFFGRHAAVIAVWVLAGNWLTTVIFKAAIADALLNALLCWAVFAVYRYLQAPSTAKLFNCGLAIGLGFLTKGPVAIVLPLGSAFIALLLVGRLREFWPAVLHPAAWLTVLVIVIPWHVASYFDQGTAFFEGFYLGHNLGRFSDTMESHGGQLWYYAVMMPLIVLPFVAWLPGLLLEGLRVLRAREDLLRIYLWVWFLITFAVFSVSKTQLPHYLLYGMTPIFIMLADRVAQDHSVVRWRSLPGFLFVLLFALLFALFPLALPYVATKDAYLAATLALGQHVFFDNLIAISALVALLGLASVAVLWRPVGRVSLLFSAAVLVLVVNFIAMPIVAGAQQGPVKQAGLIASVMPSSQPLVAWRVRMPSFSVYAQRIVPNQQPVAGDVVFTRINKLDQIRALNSAYTVNVLFSQGGIVLAKVELQE